MLPILVSPEIPEIKVVPSDQDEILPPLARPCNVPLARKKRRVSPRRAVPPPTLRAPFGRKPRARNARGPRPPAVLPLRLGVVDRNDVDVMRPGKRYSIQYWSAACG